MINADVNFFDREKDKVKKLFDEYPNLIKKIVVLHDPKIGTLLEGTSWYFSRSKTISLNSNIDTWIIYHEFGHVLQHAHNKVIYFWNKKTWKSFGEDTKNKIGKFLEKIEDKINDGELPPGTTEEIIEEINELVADIEAIKYFGDEARNALEKVLRKEINSLQQIGKIELQEEIYNMLLGVKCKVLKDTFNFEDLDDPIKIIKDKLSRIGSTSHVPQQEKVKSTIEMLISKEKEILEEIVNKMLK